MKKTCLLLAALLSMSGSGCGQIAGVGNRITYTPVPIPTASPAPGTYSSTQTVTLTGTPFVDHVCYTTDGSIPTATNLYTTSVTCTGTSSTPSGGIAVSSTTTINAINFPGYDTVTTHLPRYGYGPSPELVATYIITAGYGYADYFPYSAGDLVSVSSGNWSYQTSGSSEFSVTTGSPNTVALHMGGSCSSGFCFARWTGAGGTAPANQSASVTYTGISSDAIGPAVRVDTGGATTGYAAVCTDAVSGVPHCWIDKVVSGTVTTLTSTSGSAIPATSTVKLTASGTSSTALTLYVNGSSYQTYTDSSSPITSGTGGIGGAGNNGNVHISNATGTTP